AALQDAKLRSPPTDCLAPIGVRQMLAGMLKGVQAEFYTASTRSPAVYRGNPFQIEAAIAYGGDLPGDQQARIIRFANRVPLLYQPAACSITKAVAQTNWRNYGLSQPRNSVPEGPVVVFVHMASVWVPFTSESKEAVADYDEIRKEIQLAIKECGRKLNTFIRRKQRVARENQRRDVFAKYIGEVVSACEKMTDGLDPEKLYEQLKLVAKSRTEVADRTLDDEGNFVKPAPRAGKLDGDQNVVVIERDNDDPTTATDESGAEGNVPEAKVVDGDLFEHNAA
ncbi:MAG: hypothetical protein AAGK78_12345, partial [Planctomycetota bacterium]